jgi:hypothetical protein
MPGLRYLCLVVYSCVQNILCFCFVFLRLVYRMLPVSLDCLPFLIVSLVFSKYSQRVPGITFIAYAHSQQLGKQNKLNVFRSNNTKGPKQDSQRGLKLLRESVFLTYPLVVTTNQEYNSP